MKREHFLALLGMIVVLLASCSSPDNDGGSNQAQALCGNGVLEAGESAQSCCQDAGCGDFQECREIQQAEDAIHTCAQLAIDETEQYASLLENLDDIEREYEKESDLISHEYIRSRVDRMNRSVEELAKQYDVAVHRRFVEYQAQRTILNEQQAEGWIAIDDAVSEDEALPYARDVLNIKRQFISLYDSFSAEDRDLIEEVYDFDVSEYEIRTRQSIQDLEESIATAEAVPTAEISVVDYGPECYSSVDECWLDYVKIEFSNTGEVDILDPAFDFILQDELRTVGREVDVLVWDVTALRPGQEVMFREDLVFWSDSSAIQEGEYTLKVVLKEDVSVDEIASTEVSIRLR